MILKDVEPTLSSLQIEVASLKLLHQIVRPPFIVRTDQTYIQNGIENVNLMPKNRVAFTSPEEPAILLEYDASLCTLFLGFNTDGEAGLFHEGINFIDSNTSDETWVTMFNDHLQKRVQALITGVKSKLKRTNGTGTFVVSGQWALAESQRKTALASILNQVPAESLVQQFSLKKKGLLSRIFQNGKMVENISGMIFIAKYLAKDNQNHLLLMDSSDDPEKAKLLKALKPHVKN